MTNTIRTRRALILLGALASTITILGCSKKNHQPVMNTSSPVAGVVRPAALQTYVATPKPIPVAVAEKATTPEKPLSKLITYKSRDYGVSFTYPRQYAYKSAKTISQSEELMPKPDGSESQFTLIRIDVPKGYYPETNFDSGYFTLSLNDDLSDELCEASLTVDKSGTPEKVSINGLDFQWSEAESGGHGNAAKIRNYVTYANGTCYEIEVGVKTRNEQGLAREIDPDQVFKRLEAILQTVQIQPDEPKTMSQK